ncbi:WD40-repeat-containing domain protein [Phascolomyces articulosus]|uniref:WD40-repeat-containing domain protein n=1 Tax=Phascolomyces articulosus TaxID=60185 RepID=A0AAD5K7I6_9FUNG|nr:WD40-repeat-containing domain protein [Phascolomyces articulosus]
MDDFVFEKGHTPPATPPPNNGFHVGGFQSSRPTQRFRSSYLDITTTSSSSSPSSPNHSTATLTLNDSLAHSLDKRRLEYIGNVTKNFQQFSSDQKQLFLSEILNCCDTPLLSFVHELIAPRLKIDFLKQLPIELSLHVISFIDDPQDLANASRVSSFWNSLLKDEATWKSLCLKHRYRRRSSFFDLNSSWQHQFQQHKQLQQQLQQRHHLDTTMEEEGRTTGSQQQQSHQHVSYRDYFWHKYNTEMAWRQGTGQVIHCQNDIGRALVTSLQMDDQYLVMGCDNHKVEVFDSNTGLHIRTLQGHEGGVWALQFIKRPSDDQRILVTGGCDRVVMVWNLETGQLIHSLSGHSSTVRCLRIDNEGKKAVTGSRDATVRIWDIENGVSHHVCTGHQASVRCMDIHDNLVATGSYDATAKLFDIQTGECRFTYFGHHSQIYSIAFDGIRIVTGSLDWSIKVWDPIGGSCLATLTGHTSLVGHLQLSTPYESSPLLVSGASDGCLRIWELRTFRCKHQVSAHDSSVSCLQADQKRILSGGSDGRVKLWNLETGHLIRDFTDPSRTVWKLQFTDTKAVVVSQKPRTDMVIPVDPSFLTANVQTVIELHKFDVNT